jgi:large subunit ribosomal protein L9
LYGSVTARDISDAVETSGFKIDRSQVRMERNYKLLGLYPVKVFLHPEVMVEVTINIARSTEEAKIQEERGEALIVKSEAQEAASLAVEAAKRAEANEKAAALAAAAVAEAAPAEAAQA